MCVRISPQGEADGGAACSTAGAEAEAEAWPEAEAETEAEAEAESFANPGGGLGRLLFCHTEWPSLVQLDDRFLGHALAIGVLCSG